MPLPTVTRATCRCAIAGALLAACSSEPPPPPFDATSAPGLPVAEPNDVTKPAGRMVGDTLVVELTLQRAAWRPRGPEGPRIPVIAFAEGDGPPTVPGPLVRAPVGTPVRLEVRSALDVAAQMRSAAIPGSDTTEIPAGGRHTLAFTATTPVSSAYQARIEEATGPSGASVGALVIDPAGASPHPDERILLISSWGALEEPGSLDSDQSWKMLVNGRSWPFNERLEYAVGDTARWRVISVSGVRHPMHLHGFYFNVTSAGDLVADTLYAAGSRAPVVTHLMANEAAMTLEWVPHTAGNWLFHCHLLRHMGPTQRFAADAGGAGHAQHGDSSAAMDDGMAGLITGVTVRPGPDGVAAEAPPARRLDLWTGTTAGGYGASPRLAFVLQQGDAPPPDSAVVPSSTLVLHRDEPTEIVIHNRLDFPLSVHWHGLELRSAYDGVGHWSGMPGMTTPPVPPGDSGRVLLQPPKAGTFIYHTHGEEGFNLSQGLYGSLLVLEPGAAWDRDADRVYLMGAGGASRDADPALNGVLEPPAERFEPGTEYHLRFIQIAADESKVVELLRDGEPATWRALAKDGATLAPAQQLQGPARVRAEVGETFDFAWRPESSGVYQLRVKTVIYPLDAEWFSHKQVVAFGVGDVTDADLASAHDGFDRVLPVGTLITVALGAIVALLLTTVTLAWRWFRRRQRRRAALAALRA